MTQRHEKAHLVRGGLNGTQKYSKGAQIINQLFTSSKQYRLMNWRYNSISLKTWQYAAPDKGGFVLPSNIGAMRSHIRAACGLSALGVLASGNAPADHVGESTPTLIGGFQSLKRGGDHA